MRNGLRLTCFAALSIVLHAWIYARATDRGSALADALRAAPREITALGTTVVPIAEPETAATPPPPAPKPAPVESTRVESAPVEPAAPAEPLPRLTRAAPTAGVDEGRPATPPVPEPASASESPGRDVVETPFATESDYLAHVLARADRAPKDGTPVPDLVIDLDLSDADLRSVIRFYGMKVVAYPLSGDEAPAFYLELAGDDFATATRREGGEPLAGFSNRARDLTAHPAFWSRLSRVAARHHVDPYHARIAAVVPERVDGYFLRKQRAAARTAGLALDAVRSTQARFRRTNVGWMLAVHAVTPKTGRTVPVPSDPRGDWE